MSTHDHKDESADEAKTDLKEKHAEETTHDAPKAPAKPSAHKRPLLIGGVVAGLLVLVAGLTAAAYGLPVTSGLVRGLSKVLPYPAIVVNSEIMSMGEFLDEYDGLTAYLAKDTPDMDPETLRSDVLEAMVNKIATAQIAKERGIEPDQDYVDFVFSQIYAGTGGEDQLAAQLEEDLGWSVDEFSARIVQPIALAVQLQEQVLQDADAQAPRLDEINGARQEIVDGADFDAKGQEIADKYGLPVWKDTEFEDLASFPEDWQASLADVEVGQLSEVFDAETTYVFARLDEKEENKDGTQVKLSLVAVPKLGLEDVVKDYLASSRVWHLVRNI